MEGKVSEVFNDNQKDFLYETILAPLKNRISQILLYDSNAAAEFLVEYNTITNNQEISASELMNEISALEKSIGIYEEKTGKEKLAGERAKILSRKIREFNTKSVDMSTEEFEKEFLEFRESYDEVIGRQIFSDRDVLEQKFHSLQADLIIRKISDPQKLSVDLNKIIKEEDRTGLSIWVRNKVMNLKENSKYTEFAGKINDILLLREDAVMLPELWKWVAAAEKGKVLEVNSQEKEESTDLILAQPEKKIGFFGKVAKSFSLKPKYPLDMSDIKKIDLKWLATQIPQGMLIEEEKKRLEKEGKVADEMYIPSGEYVLFQLMDDVFNTGMKERKDTFVGENGANVLFFTKQERSIFHKYDGSFSTTIMAKVGDKESEIRTENKTAEMLEYAELLDKICGSNFKHMLLEEIKGYYFDETVKLDTRRYTFAHALEKMSTDFNKRKLDVWGKEKKKREIFYRDNPLKDKAEIEREELIEKYKKTHPQYGNFTKEDVKDPTIRMELGYGYYRDDD